VWNYIIGVAMDLFTMDPKSADNGYVGSVIYTFYCSIKDIALPIAIVFFLFAICKNVSSSPPDQQPHRLMNDVVKLCIFVGVLANLWDIMGYIMQIGNGITAKLNITGTATLSMSTELSDAIAEAAEKPDVSISGFSGLGTFIVAYLEWGLTNLLFFLAGCITLVIIISSSLSIVNCGYQRILKPMLILPFSSIAVAVGAGTHEGERIMVSYLKTFFGYCISGAYMVICVKLGPLLANGLISVPSGASLYEKILYVSIQNMVAPLAVAGLCKSADSVIQRFF
jgi:hypothetical protein